MTNTDFNIIGRGVYSLPEAEQLIGVPAPRIRRWMEGYKYKYKGSVTTSPPILQPVLGRDAGVLALAFADLIEVRFLDAFIRCGVSHRTVRIATPKARAFVGDDHPFSNRRFRTDGAHILLEISQDGDTPELLDLINEQFEFERILRPLLREEFDYGRDGRPLSWWPLGEAKRVVVDPARSFGAPIDGPTGVRTRVLANAVRAEGSQRAAARIFEVPTIAVRHALEFEETLARAA